METIRLFDAHVLGAESPDEEYVVRDLLDAMYESKERIAHRGVSRCDALLNHSEAQQPHADLY